MELRETSALDSATSLQPPHSCRLDEYISSKVNGHPKFADLIAKEEGGFAIFRRFASLNAKNLLYLQAELLKAERDLAMIEIEAPVSEDGALTEAALLMGQPPGNDEHWKKILEIRELIRQYNNALLQYESLSKLPEPHAYDKLTLRCWLEDDRESNGGGFLKPPECCIWHGDTADLVALSTHTRERDPFSRWFTYIFVPFLKSKLKRETKKQLGGGYWEYNDKSINRITDLVSTVLSSMLPTTCIFGLYFLTSPITKLVFTLLSSAVFSACLAIFTSARRVDIFIAALGLAAIQVVFIAGNV